MGSEIFFTVIALGVVGLFFYVLRLIREGAKEAERLNNALLDIERRGVSDEMEREHDEDTEAILRDIATDNGNGNRVRSPHLRNEP